MLYATPELDARDLEVVTEIREMKKTLRYQVSQPKRWPGLLRRVSLARAIRASNSIEGYNVTDDDALAAVEGDQPLEAEPTPWQAVTGYRDAMTYVLQLSDDPHFAYGAGLLRSLHFMMMHYDLTKNPGRWRPGAIYVRNERGEIEYEGPDADLVPKLMAALVEALNSPPSDIPVMIRAAMAHLNLVMIHPFSDGNGRMGRCLQTLVLAQEGILAPQFCSIEEYLGANTLEYYSVLSTVGKGRWSPHRDAHPWVRFCLTAHYRQAGTFLRRVREIARVWTALEDDVAKRQLPERVVCALTDASFGLKVRNSSYRSAADINDNLASRDLKQLVRAGYLIPKGETRGRYYEASPWLKDLRDSVRELKVVADPFATSSSTGQQQLFEQSHGASAE